MHPTKIVCIGRSFSAHAKELGNAVPTAPIFFLKAPSARIGPGDAIELPAASAEVHHEAEAAIVVGTRLCCATEAEAEAAIGAWTVLNDVTARDLQAADKGRFTRAKGFDTFCPISDDRVPTLADWRQCRIQGRVNGELRQDAPLAQLMWSPAEMLMHVSAVMTLLPGDIVSLGTPAGVGALAAGDTVQVQLVDPAGAPLATVSNPVRRSKIRV